MRKILEKTSYLTAIHAYLLLIAGVIKFSDTGVTIDILKPVIFAVPLLTLNNGVKFGDKASQFISLFLSLASVVVISYFMIRGGRSYDSSYMPFDILLVVTGILAFLSLLYDRRLKKNMRKKVNQYKIKEI